MNSPVNGTISCVIPVHNEEETVARLHGRIGEVFKASGISAYDICFVDDGSTDQSWGEIEKLCGGDPEHTLGIRLRRNFGKADALQAGFAHVEGDFIITLDGDLQDDPEEIPKLLEKLEEGYDLVSGWKKKRHDPIHKTLPSKLFNLVARAVSGVPLHDFNCGFKIYRRDVVRSLQLYGELHRFIPILAHAEGFRVAECPVVHHPRRHGVSKYGSRRLLKGLLDLVTVTVITRYLHRPAHIFGGAGIVVGGIGFVILAYLSLAKIIAGAGIGGRPLFFMGILLLLLGAQLVSLGVVAELITLSSQREERIENRIGEVLAHHSPGAASRASRGEKAPPP